MFDFEAGVGARTHALLLIYTSKYLNENEKWHHSRLRSVNFKIIYVLVLVGLSYGTGVLETFQDFCYSIIIFVTFQIYIYIYRVLTDKHHQYMTQ